MSNAVLRRQAGCRAFLGSGKTVDNGCGFSRECRCLLLFHEGFVSPIRSILHDGSKAFCGCRGKTFIDSAEEKSGRERKLSGGKYSRFCQAAAKQRKPDLQQALNSPGDDESSAGGIVPLTNKAKNRQPPPESRRGLPAIKKN